MENFTETSETKLAELFKNLTAFEGGNISAGTRVRKNAQELKGLLQDLRVGVLDEQKKMKDENKKKPKKAKSAKTGKTGKRRKVAEESEASPSSEGDEE